MYYTGKILLFAAGMFILVMPLYGQYQPHLPDLRACETFNCPANNFSIQSVYLSDINGEPITNTVRSCSPGQVIDVYISIRYSSNSGSSVNNGRILADLYIGDTRIFINYFVGVLVPSAGETITLVDDDLRFSWTCGDEVNLVNPHTIYTTTAQVDHSVSYGCGSNSYNRSQCGNTSSISVSTPHIVDFEFDQGCTNAGETQVFFTNTSRGGTGSFNYFWEFMTGMDLASSTEIDPAMTYLGDGDATLVVRDENGILLSSYTQTVTLRDTQVVNPFTSMTINQTDTIQPDGAIILDVIGTGTYTFLWTGPDDFHSDEPAIYGLQDGIYTVTVTDESGCHAVYEFQLPAFVALPLSVDFSRWKYNQWVGGVELGWRVLDANREYVFYIQRSKDGVDRFEDIGAVNGGTDGSTVDVFRFVDHLTDGVGGRYYYRIVVRGINDQKDALFSEIRMVQVPRSTELGSWKLFPNPVGGNALFLQYTGSRFAEGHLLHVKVFSPTSGTVWVWEGNLGRIDLSDSLSKFPKGLFFVEVYYAGQREVFKVVH
jgi:hypothetical protein